MSKRHDPLHDPEFEALAHGYLDETLHVTELNRFAELLKQDPARVKRLAELAQLHQMIASEVVYREQAQRYDGELDRDGRAAAQALAELARLHEAGLNDPIQLEAHRRKSRDRAVDPAQRRTAIKARLIITGGLAATIALAGLIAMFVSVLTQTSHQQADHPHNQDTARIVATLTATHNATWAGSASTAPGTGDTLAAGQRLNLTAGFAEFTTARGAKAIVEAPATIEFTDNDNALRLVEGKLVGIVETPRAKGFTVRTDHMDVTDLGTRFGVDATRSDQTEVHVFDGEVELARPAIGTGQATRKTLYQGQAARAQASTAGFVDRPSDADRFAKDMDVRWLAGTGRFHSAGEADRNWRVVAVDGQPVTEHREMIVVPDHHEGDSDPATSQWLLINEALNPPGKRSAVFTCRAAFQVPDTIDPDQAKLVIRCSADFSVKAVRINGQALSVPSNRIGVGDPWVTLTLADHFTPGQNTIEIDVYEVFYSTGKANSSSLRVELQAHRRERPQ